ncbi:odorant-binding protein 59a [Homalodisca vitripennis]|uniref:odorant-binding protein 59a n=1 Tax=Homalodisca vitripennis TaxID=197043 RepID=UPI001EE9F767|nr:odorant-binding protein 59a [Homalodisca vitripennis]
MSVTAPMKSSYSYIFICSILIAVTVTAGLKCRVDNDEHTQESFQDVVRSCMSADLRDEEVRDSRQHPPRTWQHRQQQWGQGIPRFPTKNDRDGNKNQNESDEDDDDNSGELDYNRGNAHRGYHPRSRRSQPPRSMFGSRNNQTTRRRNSNTSPIQDIEPCIIHCIFREMKMLDSKNQLEKTSVVNAMTTKMRDPELKDFIRDAISECFEILDSESHNTKCTFSKGFALCMEQKGQQHCDDWDENTKKSKQKNNVITNKHRG